MYVVIEYERPEVFSDESIEVARVHGPFDTERQAYDWANADGRGFYQRGGFDVMELSSVT